MTWIPWAIIAVVFGIFLYMVRKSGEDSAEKGAAVDALKDINNALRPPTADELDSVRKQNRRD